MLERPANAGRSIFVQNNELHLYNQYWQNKVAVPLSYAKGHGEIKRLV